MLPPAKKAACLTAALLLVCAACYLLGGKGYLRSGDPGPDAAGKKAGKEAGKEGELPPNWFAGVGKPKDDDISDDIIVRAKQLQEERLSREISLNPAGTLNNATISDLRLPDMKLANTTINGARFINCLLPGFTAEKVTFNNVSFHRVAISKAILTRATFNNCIFENSHIDGGILTGITFKRGEFRRVAAESIRTDVLPGLFRCSFTSTSFDGTGFRDAGIREADGEIRFRNIDIGPDRPSSDYLVSGSGLLLRLENSSIKNMRLAYLGENNKLHAVKSTFKGSGLVLGKKSVAYLDQCRLETETRLAVSGLAVLRGCRVNALVDAENGSKLFFENCEFEEDSRRGSASNTLTVIRGANPAEVNLLGSPGPARIDILNGGLTHVQNMTLLGPVIAGQHAENRTLNLLDVVVRGADLSDMKVTSGVWKNVDLQPAITTSSSTFLTGLSISNVTQSKGAAWASGAPPDGFPARDAETGLERKKAPTPEELGMPRI